MSGNLGRASGVPEGFDTHVVSNNRSKWNGLWCKTLDKNTAATMRALSLLHGNKCPHKRLEW